MKKIFALLVILYTLTACDDGDIIITGFEFDDTALQLCTGAAPNEFVYFKINNEAQETLSLTFTAEDFSETTVTAENPILITLDETNNPLRYRKFSTDIDASYFCNNIPPTGINVNEELISTAGEAEIVIVIDLEDDNDGVDAIDESFGPATGVDPRADLDEDGVPNYLDDERNNPAVGDVNGEIEEGFNTDDDNIPNFLDQDDDNDNILTSTENSLATTDGFPDFDEDGIPDFLDEDDDQDGILTRDEDENDNENPRDDRDPETGKTYYLDATLNSINVNTIKRIDNNIRTTFKTTITIKDIIFSGDGNQDLEDDAFIFGTKERAIDILTEL